MNQQFDLLEKYIDGNISSKDKELVEQLIESDLTWKNEYILRMDVNKAIGEKEIMQLRYKLGVIHDAEFPNSKGKVRNLFEKKWHLAAASITILVILGSFLLKNLGSPQPEQLFKKYYNTENAVFTTRSNDSNENIDLKIGLQHFQKRNYKQAISSLKNNPDNLVAEYYLGISYIETEQFLKASEAFNVILKKEINLFTEQAEWYKALCLLKLNDINTAKHLFTSIHNSNSIYNKNAEEILIKLK